MNLDLLHIHGGSADFSGHQDALALNAGGIGGHEAGQVRLVLHNHVQVGAETAGGQDNGLRVHGHLVSGFTLGFNADNSAGFVGQQLGGGYVSQQRQVVAALAGWQAASSSGTV